MGRRWKNNKKRKLSEPRRDDRDRKDDGFKDWTYSNENFEKYYKAQGIVNEQEWQPFVDSLAKSLPSSFRINNSCDFADSIRNRIATEFHFKDLQVDGEKIDPIESIAWYPNKNGFQWSLHRQQVKKMEQLKEYQKWIVSLSDSGNITRQEAVSMIPPLILNVESHHKVLDMCAAPGSKTSQLLEMIHADEAKTGQLPTGIVVANDVDIKRAYLLVHQSKRINTPSLLVTCCKAQRFPRLKDASGDSTGYFDRILCDAPCSGDGTMRKNPMIWRNWNLNSATSLHKLQIQIAMRGVYLLKVGGLMCYSTCSFNPIENEAVVAELLRRSNGSLELVDVSQVLPKLKRRPGLTTWKVFDNKLIPVTEPGVVEASHFPPTEDEVKAFNLDRCMRCLPHDQDTGGFFICLLRKTANLYTSTTGTGEREDEKVEEEPKTKEGRVSKENYAKVESETMAEAKEFFGLADSFPTEQLITKSSISKIINFATAEISTNILDQLQRSRVKVVYSGCKVFEKCSMSDAPCAYRVAQSGAHIMLPFMSKRIVPVTHDDFTLLLQTPAQESILFEKFSEKTTAAFQQAEIGSLVCTTQDYVLTIWRGKKTVSIMAAKDDIVTLQASLAANSTKETVDQ